MFLSLLSISASLVSCGNNNAPAPFSPEYVENYLETCYGTDFTYTGEFSSDDAALEAYTFKDSSGMAMHIELTDAEGDTLYYINVPSVKKGEFPYIKSKPELVTEAQNKYNNNAEMRKSLGRK